MLLLLVGAMFGSLVSCAHSLSTQHHGCGVSNVQQQFMLNNGRRNRKKFLTIRKLSKTDEKFNDFDQGGLVEIRPDNIAPTDRSVTSASDDDDDDNNNNNNNNNEQSLTDDNKIATTTSALDDENNVRKNGDTTQSLFDVFVSFKESIYAKIRQVLSDIITIIKRSVQKTDAWVRDDAVGQLVASALSLIFFFAGVAAFAAWNIEVLGGKKWSGPSQVTVPTVKVPPAASSTSSGVTFQKPKWNFPGIQTSYSNNAEKKTSINEIDKIVELQ